MTLFNADSGTPGFNVHVGQEWESVPICATKQTKEFSVKLASL